MSIAEHPALQQPAYPLRPLRDTFADPESLKKGIVAFYDQRDSTAAKINKTEAAWVTETAFLYDTVILTAQSLYPGVVWNVLGDGVVLFYPDSNAALAALQSAIAVLEIVEKANRPIGDGDKGSIDMQLSVGIGSGHLRWFQAPGGAANAIGTVADRAARLCAAASPQALFIDSATASATNFLDVESDLGRVMGRLVEEYQGEKQTVVLKGLKDPVAYYEVMWGRQRFGVKSEVLTVAEERVTAAVDKVARDKQAAPSRPTGRAISTTQGEKLTGTVKNWEAPRGFGFITADSGEELFFAPNLMVHPEDVGSLVPGTKVAFTGIEPSSTGKNRRAAAVLVEGQYADGQIAKLPSDGSPYGWVTCSDQGGHHRFVHATAKELAGFKVSDEVSFKLAIGSRGATAIDIAVCADDDEDEATEPTA